MSGLASPNNFHSRAEEIFSVVPRLSGDMEEFFGSQLLVQPLMVGDPALSSRGYGYGFMGRSMEEGRGNFPFQLPPLPVVPPASYDVTPPQEGDTAEDIPPADTPPGQVDPPDSDQGPGYPGPGFVGWGGVIIIVEDKDDDTSSSGSTTTTSGEPSIGLP